MLTFFAILVSFCTLEALAVEVEVAQQWNFFDFDFPYDYEFINRYRPENSVFTGLEVTEDRFFVSIPRLRRGVPATLAVIPKHAEHGTPLRAYPDWSFHSAGKGNTNCSGLISVYRIRKDSCNRLWVLDSGVMSSLEDFTRVCPPKILIFDLHTDQVLRTIIFPRQVLRPNSLLTNLIIDESVQGRCDSSFVYISDTAAPGLIVYDSTKDTAWRVMHPSMFPDPDFSDSTIEGETFTLMDGIVGITHSPKLATVFFQPLATNRVFSIPTAALRKGPPAEGEALPVRLVGTKSSQGIGLTLDPRDDTLFFSPVTETSVASWNPVTNHQKVIAYEPALLQFPAEIRWVPEDSDSIWLISTRFQKFFRRTVTPKEVNLRIIRIPLQTGLNNGFTNTIAPFFKK